MSKTAATRTITDRQRDAARDIDTALTYLRRAAGHLEDEDGELAFCGQIKGDISNLEYTADRLRQYAANGW